MAFYLVRVADIPVIHLADNVRFRNIILTNEFDSPELVSSFLHRLGFRESREGTTVLKTREAILVTQKIVITFDRKPSLDELRVQNAIADKELFDAIMIAKTSVDIHGNRI